MIAVASAWMNGSSGLHSLLVVARAEVSAAVAASGTGGG